MKIPKSLEEINILVTKKKIKNIIIKIPDEKTVKISIPMSVTKTYLEEILRKREEWILETIKKLKAKPISPTYNDGQLIKLIDRRYILKLISSPKPNIYEKNSLLCLELPDINNVDLKKQALDFWYRKNGYEIFPSIIDKYLKLTGKKISKLTVKTLKRNWGSCQVRTREINLNSELLKKPLPFIEYVILHEIAHLEHPNHSKDFYAYVEKFMPDWRDRKKLEKGQI